MAAAVVDLLESVDVDVGENQLSASVAGAVDLPLEQQQPDLAAERAGELVHLGSSEVVSAQAPVAVRARSTFDGRLTIGGCELAVFGALAAVGGPLIGCGLGEVVVGGGLSQRSGVLVAWSRPFPAEQAARDLLG